MSLNLHPKLALALESFTNEYVKNPFRYLYEADVQVLLAKHLELIFNEKHLIKGQMASNKDKTFDIGKVHREYPRFNLTKPIDVVVLGQPRYFSEEQLRSQLLFENFYEQPIDYAIELKLLYLNEQRTDRLNISIDDYERFVKCKLDILSKSFKFKYGLQLTLFQSSNDHDNNFLNYLNDPRYRDDYEKKRKEYYDRFKDQFGFYYINMNTEKIEEVWT